MIRQIATAVMIVSALFASEPGKVPNKSRKSDGRLLGTWISDKEETLKHYKFKESSTPEKRIKFGELFGKLKITYTHRLMTTDMDGVKDSGPYEVIASDSNSVVLQVRDFDKSPKLVQIHFCESGYYVVSGFFLKFFKRIPA